MKYMLKSVSLLITVLLLTGICACKKNNDVISDDSGISFSLGEDSSKAVADTGSTVKKESNTTSSKANSSKNSNSGVDIMEKTESIKTTREFTPMQIPSRANAYKLSNTYSKIKKGESVKVVYIGGSVTGGTGASDENKFSWAALTTKYLKSITPGGINGENVAVGGSGSYLGAVRFEHDVSSKNPDLVFIEFAINDNYEGYSEDTIKLALEYMINNLYSKNPYADIVMVLITNTSTYGKHYKNYEVHKSVADHYSIPIVDLGGEMYNRLKGSQEGFSDSVHPNDKGYQIYSEIMIDALKELLVDGAVAPHPVPARLCANGYSTITSILAKDVTANGWKLYSWRDNTVYEKDGSQFRRSGGIVNKLFPNYIATKNVGSKVSLNFTGNSFGILGTVKENVQLEVVVDGNQSKTIYGTSSSNKLEYPLFNGLANTTHTVTITVAGTDPYAALAAFIVGS